MPRTQEQLELVRSQTRNKIIETALKLFSQKGFHATSMSEIAKQAGIAKGLAYNYFESKQHLLDAIFDYMIETGIQVFDNLKKNDDPYEQLSSLIENSFNYALEYEELWQLYMRVALQPEAISSTENSIKKFSKIIFEQIKKIFRKIGFKNADAEAQLFSASIDGLLLYYLLDPETFPLKKAKKIMSLRYSKEGINSYLRSLNN